MDADPEMEEDELEYYVTFPAAVSPEFTDGGYEEAEKEPVVFLFGWTGCKDRHLAKYAEMYKELGCVTIRYISPVNYIFFTPRELLDVADQLIDLITDLTLEVHPLLFHCFSNGGALVYLCLTRRLRERRITLDVRAALFDSGPLAPSLSAGWAAIHIAITGPRWYRWMVGICFVLLHVFSLLWYHAVGFDERVLHPWVLRTSPDRWPQMFLYSHADAITPAKDVEQFMAERRACGVDVTSHVFDGSAHVLHYRAFPDSYRAAVAALLSRVCGPAACPAAAAAGGSPCRPGSSDASARMRRPGSGDKR